MTLKRIAKNVINLLYPLHCEYCKKGLGALADEPLCLSCKGQIKLKHDIRTGSKGPRSHFAVARSACIYEGVLKELIHSFKYKGKVTLAGTLASYMVETASQDNTLMDGLDAVTFVPMQDGVLKTRDYNHSGVLAGLVARHFSLPLLDTLKKTRRTRPQNELSRDQRLTNLIGAFRIRRKNEVVGLKILLIDDVMTTGATLDECSRVLIDSGAKEVRCLTLSRGI